MPPIQRPRISVIVVSDYDGAGAGDRHDEFHMMRALAAQDITEPFEIVLAESENGKSSFPPDLLTIAPLTRAVFLPHTRSSSLKDAALAFTSGRLVAVFEADSPPRPQWLRLLTETLDRHPEADAISGRTIYGYDSALKRAAGLIHRGYIEEKGISPTIFVCNNGALYRRELLEAYRYDDMDNPFVTGRTRHNAMEKAGVKLLFHPQAVVVHEFGGWKFLREVHRNLGFSDGREAWLARDQPLSWRAKLPLSFALAGERLWWDLCTCRKAAGNFIYWYDWPLVILLLIVFRCIEWPAMARGLAGEQTLRSTAYR
jgi:cellulose synthase/poly-beta-1,6-N-acetylglucosamine synthase-like glycosyltransferase